MAGKGEQVTTKFTVDISELKANIQEANRQIRLANSEFKAASAGMDDWGKSADGLSAKLRQLYKVQFQQNAVLDSLEKQLRSVEKEYGENSKAADDLRIKINNQKAALGKTEKDIRKYKDALNNLETSSTDAEKDIGNLNDELQDNKRKLSDAEQAANDLGNEYKEAGDSAKTAEGGFTVLKGALANLASDAIQGAISKIQEFVQSLFELSEATEEYRLMQAKLSGSAQTFGYDIDFVKEKYKEFYSYLGDDQAATNAITNLEGMGVSTETVSKSAEAAIAVWTAYGDSIPIESLTESINESSQVAKVTGVLADALNWAGISEDDFNAKLETCNSTQERADLIAQTLNDTYGESKTRFDEMSGSILDSNKAQLELKDTQAQLGQAMEPVNTALTEMKNDILGKLVPIVETCADAFMKFKNWLDEGGTAATIAQAALVGLGTAAGVAATAFGGMLIIKTVTAAINAAKVAMAALNITMSANPIVLVIAAIAGLVAAFVTLWNTSEEFRDFWTGLWDTIKTAAGNALDAIVNFFAQLPSRIWTFLQTAWEKVSTWVSQMVQKAVEVGSQFLQNVVSFFTQLPSKVWGFLQTTISNVANFVQQMIQKAIEAGSQFLNNVVSFVQQLPSKVWGFLTDAISKAGQFASQMGSKAREAGTQFLNNIVKTLSSIPSRVVSIGEDIVRGIWSGIQSMVGWIGKQISGFAGGILGGIKKFFGIASPSKVMRKEIGRFLPEGLALGIADKTKTAVNAMKDMGAKMKGALGLDDLQANISTKVSGIRKKISGSIAGLNTEAARNQTVVFNQYNTSPKSLSRLDLYRQTKNQLFSAKERLKYV